MNLRRKHPHVAEICLGLPGQPLPIPVQVRQTFDHFDLMLPPGNPSVDLDLGAEIKEIAIPQIQLDIARTRATRRPAAQPGIGMTQPEPAPLQLGNPLQGGQGHHAIHFNRFPEGADQSQRRGLKRTGIDPQLDRFCQSPITELRLQQAQFGQVSGPTPFPIATGQLHPPPAGRRQELKGSFMILRASFHRQRQRIYLPAPGLAALPLGNQDKTVYRRGFPSGHRQSGQRKVAIAQPLSPHLQFASPFIAGPMYPSSDVHLTTEPSHQAGKPLGGGGKIDPLTELSHGCQVNAFPVQIKTGDINLVSLKTKIRPTRQRFAVKSAFEKLTGKMHIHRIIARLEHFGTEVEINPSGIFGEQSR